MYKIERLIKGQKNIGVKYLMLQRQLNGILYQLFSIPFQLVVVRCFFFCLDWKQGKNRVSFPYFKVANGYDK